jgi:hypothetical protein
MLDDKSGCSHYSRRHSNRRVETAEATRRHLSASIPGQGRGPIIHRPVGSNPGGRAAGSDCFLRIGRLRGGRLRDLAAIGLRSPQAGVFRQAWRIVHFIEPTDSSSPGQSQQDVLVFDRSAGRAASMDGAVCAIDSLYPIPDDIKTTLLEFDRLIGQAWGPLTAAEQRALPDAGTLFDSHPEFLGNYRHVRATVGRISLRSTTRRC